MVTLRAADVKQKLCRVVALQVYKADGTARQKVTLYRALSLKTRKLLRRATKPSKKQLRGRSHPNHPCSGGEAPRAAAPTTVAPLAKSGDAT